MELLLHVTIEASTINKRTCLRSHITVKDEVEKVTKVGYGYYYYNRGDKAMERYIKMMSI